MKLPTFSSFLTGLTVYLAGFAAVQGLNPGKKQSISDEELLTNKLSQFAKDLENTPLKDQHIPTILGHSPKYTPEELQERYKKSNLEVKRFELNVLLKEADQYQKQGPIAEKKLSESLSALLKVGLELAPEKLVKRGEDLLKGYNSVKSAKKRNTLYHRIIGWSSEVFEASKSEKTVVSEGQAVQQHSAPFENVVTRREAVSQKSADAVDNPNNAGCKQRWRFDAPDPQYVNFLEVFDQERLGEYCIPKKVPPFTPNKLPDNLNTNPYVPLSEQLEEFEKKQSPLMAEFERVFSQKYQEKYGPLAICKEIAEHPEKFKLSATLFLNEIRRNAGQSSLCVSLTDDLSIELLPADCYTPRNSAEKQALKELCNRQYYGYEKEPNSLLDDPNPRRGIKTAEVGY